MLERISVATLLLLILNACGELSAWQEGIRDITIAINPDEQDGKKHELRIFDLDAVSFEKVPKNHIHLDCIIWEDYPDDYPLVRSREYSFRYNNLEEKDLLRLPGGVFQVSKIDLENAEVTLKHCPEYAVSDKDVYMMPVAERERKSAGNSSIHTLGIEIIEIKQLDNGKLAVVARTVGYNGMYYSDALDIQTATVGEKLWIGNSGHIVKAIYPRKEKERLRGWIEIGQSVAEARYPPGQENKK